MEPISPELIHAIREQYRLPWRGTHGVIHWARVREAGLRLAARTGANVAVVELFAVLHDARRRNEGIDPGHGGRGAISAGTLRGTLIHIPDAEFVLLSSTCADHTKGLLDADITIQACWDVDRLDLGRVGTTPDPARLCTAAARAPDMIRWTGQRSGGEYVPPVVDQDWDGSRSTRR
jgi:uncharacterized protein